MEEDSLAASALGASSPDALRTKAAGLGMIPAASLRELNVDTGALSAVGN